MMQRSTSALSKAQLLALRGLRLPRIALQKLRELGIYCDPAVSVERQAQAGRYVIRGLESGGAVHNLGAYCSLVGGDGNALRRLQKIDAVGRNGLHAVVVAPQLVRIQMFRNEGTFQLLITEHRLDDVPGEKRPALQNSILFHGINGTVPSAFASDEQAGMLPLFRTRSGDEVRPPDRFIWAVRKITAASSCIGCKHSHLLEPEMVSDIESVEGLPA